MLCSQFGLGAISRHFSHLHAAPRPFKPAARILHNRRNSIASYCTRSMMADASGNRPKYVDTHVHIDYVLARMEKPFDYLDTLLEEQFKNAPLVKGKEVPLSGTWEASVHITCDPATFAAARQLLKNDRIYVGAGVHPHNAKDYTDAVEQELLEMHKDPKVVAWGECGLDFHYNLSPPDTQREIFARQLKAAVSIGKPLIIHTREAEEDTYNILTSIVPSDWKIHVHCFTSSLGFAQKLMNHYSNLVFGFTGVVTFNNAKEVQQVVSFVPLERLVLETDGPYLAPAPFRGLTATSGMIPKIADKIAELKKCQVSEVYQHARQNTTKIYSI